MNLIYNNRVVVVAAIVGLLVAGLLTLMVNAQRAQTYQYTDESGFSCSYYADAAESGDQDAVDNYLYYCP